MNHIEGRVEINGKKIWQIAAGDESRSYHDIFLDWDVIAIGPGDHGRWPECEKLVIEMRGRSQANISRRFAEEIADGDIIVLRKGKTSVYGVGLVVGSYLWLDDFGDVDGWDLQHIRRVRWLWKYELEPKRFQINEIRWGDSVQNATSPALSHFLESLEISQESLVRPLVELPSSCIDGSRLKQITVEEIIDGLFDLGVDLRNVGQIVEQLREIETLARWYSRSEHKPREHETIAYLVIPLLRSLGWTPQRLAVEWKYIDIAGFGRLPRADANLRLAVEGKSMDSACLIAKEQGEKYLLSAERSGCDRLVLTEGMRYGVFYREKEVFSKHAEAYLNLSRKMRNYPITHSGGAIQAFAALSADWKR